MLNFILGSAGGNKINRVLTESWILEKVLKFAQQFSKPGKSLENGNKVWKNGKKSWVFFFSKLQQIYKWFFVLFWSNLIQSQLYDERSFIPAFLKVSIDHLVRKKKLLFWKKGWKKFWILYQKICMNPEKKKLMYYSLLSLKIISFVLFPKVLMPSLNFNNIEIGLLAWINYI